MPLLFSYYRDKILTERGLPLNFFSPVGGTEFIGNFPEDLNETFKAVTYSSDEFNIEWFFETGKTLTMQMTCENSRLWEYLSRVFGEKDGPAQRNLYNVQREMRGLVRKRGPQLAPLLRQVLFGATGKWICLDIFEPSSARDINSVI